MKNFLIWCSTVAITVCAALVYKYPVLENVVAAYSILLIILGIFVSTVLSLCVVGLGADNVSPVIVKPLI